MKYFILFFLLLNQTVQAQTKMPASTMGVVQTLKKDLLQHKGKISASYLKMFPLEEENGQYYLHVLAKTNSQFSLSELKENGWKTGTHFGNILSARMPLNLFLNSFSHPGIDYLEVAERFEPYLDQGLVDTRVDSVHQGINLSQAYTGKDVLIGVVDWGFDYSHPTFFDTAMQQYRVVAAWDQVKTTGPSPAGFSHGTLYADSASLLTAEADTFSFVSDYHGTHVAGIAGGAGAGTPYRGVGFEADLLFSQMSGHATYSLDAFQWMYNMSQTLGKRLVINNSYGSYRNNPLDGTSLTSQAIDAFSDSGVVFVFSAGNCGGTNFHMKKEFNNDSIRTRISGFNYGSDPDLWGQTITIWGEGGNDFSNKIRILDAGGGYLKQTPVFNTNTSLPFTDTFLVVNTDTIWYMVTVDAAHPLNGKPQMSIDIKSLNTSYRIILISEANTGTVHYYNTRKTIFGGGNTGFAFATYGPGYVSGDNNYGLGHPGVTNSAITIAAHTSNNGIVSFSSYGPRTDENPKPDVSAPGVNVASAYNSFSQENLSSVATVNFNGKDFDFVRLSGTSMSGPMVAGIVSLILEADPIITPQEVKDLLRVTAREDSYTGVLGGNWHNRWGWGKVNAYEAIRNLNFVSVEEMNQEGAFRIYPNPSNGRLEMIGLKGNNASYSLFSLEGKLIQSDRLNGNILELSGLKDGLYILQIEEESASEVFKIMIHP